MQLEHTSGRTILKASDSNACSVALIVEPDPRVLEETTRVLLRACKAVYAITAPGAVYEWQPCEELVVAVLSAAFGPFRLTAVTEYIRHRWPHARILVIGMTAPLLEDHLYDDALPALAGEQDILDAVGRCMSFTL